MTDKTNQLITTEIKGRTIVYFLVTKNDIDSLRGDSIFSNIFLCLFSICAGGILSIVIGKQFTSTPLPYQLLENLRIANLFMWAGLIVFLLLYSVVAFQVFKNISGITKSGTINYFGESKDEGTTNELLVTYAMYYTPSHSIDLTHQMNALIKDNRLSVLVSNTMTGESKDPQYGIRKKLKIRYSYKGRAYEKEYNERDLLELP